MSELRDKFKKETGFNSKETVNHETENLSRVNIPRFNPRYVDWLERKLANEVTETPSEHSVSHGVMQRYLVSDVIFVEIKDGKITDKLGAEISTEFIVKHEHFLGKGWGYIIL